MEPRISRDSARPRHSFRGRSFSTPGILDAEESHEDLSRTVEAYGYRGLVEKETPHDVLPGISADNEVFPSSPVYRPDDQRHPQGSSFSRPFVVRSRTREDEMFPERPRTDEVKRSRTKTIGEKASSIAPTPMVFSPSANDITSRKSNRAMAGIFGTSSDNIASRPSSRPSTAPAPAEPSSPPRGSRQGGPAATISKRTARSVSSSRSRTRLPDPSKAPQSSVQRMNARKIFHSMNTTRGRMSGSLYTRSANYARWSSTGQCCIDESAGTLVREATGQVVFPNLYRCRVGCSSDRQGQKFLVLDSLANGVPVTLQIKPKHTSQYESWFAALLCWRIAQPGQPVAQVKVEAPLTLTLSLRDSTANQLGRHKEPAIVKIGEMLMVDDPSHGDQFAHAHAQTSHKSRKSLDNARWPAVQWCKVSCRLQENGTLRIFALVDDSPLAYVNLSQLARSAVQRLHRSALDAGTCLAIYPQHARTPEACSRLRPIYLSLDSQILYESWFALLRAFTIPEIYGPQRRLPPDIIHALEDLPGIPTDEHVPIYRTERYVEARVCEARFFRPRVTSIQPLAQGGNGVTTPRGGRTVEREKPLATSYYAEVAIDGQVKCKTSVLSTDGDPSWWESFELLDVPSQASTLSIQVKKIKSQTLNMDGRQGQAARDCPFPPFREDWQPRDPGYQICGEVSVDLASIEQSKEIDKRWPMHDENGEAIGDLYLKLRTDQEIMLMDHEYNELSELLHRFENSLTIEIAERMSSELSKLSQYLLNIFQVSLSATAWFAALAEEEVDGILKDQPNMPSRFNRRLDSNDSVDSQQGAPPPPRPYDYETFVRDLTKNAATEANLLFRGNTLLTKALDTHMKRLGLSYLDETLGDKLREIARLDPDCEVDPTRIAGSTWTDLQKHWKRLLLLTEEVWALIAQSARKCPLEMRIIFRHIRACANDRYGDFQRTIPYSSVAAFLFLRFFCAAVLNPRAFSITRETIKPKAQRTFTLIAKSLQSLANMTSSGVREPWMEPMNSFIHAKRQEFKSFIDQICNVSTDSPNTSLMSPSYNSAIAMMTRLPAAFKEGFPSLPYLVDPTANFAALVRLWLNKYTPPTNSSPTSVSKPPLDGDILKFHNICLEIRRKTTEYVEQADRAERHSGLLSQKWADLAQRVETCPEDFWHEPEARSGTNDSDEAQASKEHASLRARATSSPIMMAASEDDLSASVSGGDPLSRPISPSQKFVGVLNDHDLEVQRTPLGRKEKSKHSFFGKKKKLDKA